MLATCAGKKRSAAPCLTQRCALSTGAARIRRRGDLSRWAALAGPAVLVREPDIPGNMTDRRATRPECCGQGQNLAAVDVTGARRYIGMPRSIATTSEERPSGRGSSGTRDLRFGSLMQERRSSAPNRMIVHTGASYSHWLDRPESTQRGPWSLQQADSRSRAHCDVPQAFKRALSWMANSPVFETRWQRPLSALVQPHHPRRFQGCAPSPERSSRPQGLLGYQTRERRRH